MQLTTGRALTSTPQCTQEGSFSTFPEELRNYAFEFLGVECWESVSRVSTAWNTRICKILWQKRESHPATLSYIYCLTDLIQIKNARWQRDKQTVQDYAFITSFFSYFIEEEQEFSEKGALESILNKLLNRAEKPPKTLCSILTYNTQIEKESAHILLQSINNRDDFSRLRKDLTQSSHQPASTNILNLVSLLAVKKFNTHYLGIDTQITKIIKRALHSGHVEEVMDYRKRLSLQAQGTISITRVMKKLIRRGLFHKAFSFVQHLSASQLGNNPSRSGLFYEVCIDAGFLATAATTLRQALVKPHNEEILRILASNLALIYLDLREIQQALPLICQFKLHLSSDFCNAAAEKLTSQGKFEEAIPFIRMCDENNCKVYLSPSFSQTVVKNLAQAENFEDAFSWVHIYDDLKLLPYQNIQEELFDILSQIYIQKKDPETAQSFILTTFQGPFLVRNLLRLANNHIRNDRKEKALELLKQCIPIATKDRDVLKICRSLLKLEQSELSITLIEQNETLISHIIRKKHRLIRGMKENNILSQFLQFIHEFAELNRRTIQPDQVIPRAETTQRLSNILAWIGRENRRLEVEILKLQDLLTMSIA